jgi:monoamine oxidase
VSYAKGGAEQAIDADFCICALPLTMLKTLPNDFSAPYKKVIDECTYAHAYKIAWESRRFWEQDDNVYGGLEFVNQGCSPIWFPSANLFAQRGICLSGYTDERDTPFAALTLDQKFAESRKSIERLHPGRGQELEKPMYVSWGRIQYNEGSWIRNYGPGQERESSNFLNQPKDKAQAPGISASRVTGQPKKPGAAQTRTNPGYQTLIQPDGPIFFAGDHCSHIVGWQEGAALAAKRAVGMIAERVKAAQLTGQTHPLNS